MGLSKPGRRGGTRGQARRIRWAARLSRLDALEELMKGRDQFTWPTPPKQGGRKGGKGKGG